MKKLVVILFLYPIILFSQDIKYAHYITDTLSSPEMHGRGYTFNADKMASEFIANELIKFKIAPFNVSYFQDFLINTNVFPDKMFFAINNYELKAGVDYIIDSKSKSINGTFKIIILDKNTISNTEKYQKFKQKDFSKVFLFVDTVGLNDKSFKPEYEKIIYSNMLKALGIISLSEKLVYVPSQLQADYVRIIVKQSAMISKPKKIIIDENAKYLFRYKTRNVCGFIKGEVDTFIVLSAHYDHLGTMGKDVFFPGAHDNASGCAMVLNLAKDFSQLETKPHYGIVLLFFSGEELGLLGSKYFVDHPLIPLESIKFLINIDMMGSGDEGVQIVNSTIFVNEYNKMLEINDKYKLLPEIKKRGAAANSDHYFFYQKGVPSFFIYSLGKYSEYHNVSDTRENIPFAGYENMFSLFKYFLLTLEN